MTVRLRSKKSSGRRRQGLKGWPQCEKNGFKNYIVTKSGESRRKRRLREKDLKKLEKGRTGRNRGDHKQTSYEGMKTAFHVCEAANDVLLGGGGGKWVRAS